MSLIEPVKLRLEAEVSALQKRVKGIEGLGDLSTHIRALQAFVVPGREVAAKNSAGTQLHRQLVSCPFTVILAMPGKGANGEATLIELEPLGTAIKNALAGWRHPAAVSNTQYVAGGPVDVQIGSHVIYGFDFSMEYWFETGA